ncbi:MAG: PQQ-dependent sugar dehydrogenase, partial [Chloroflexi bacterium]|nr:PQQ-dependent sugar dehydrogenase [Chloroflexota bacterium]
MSARKRDASSAWNCVLRATEPGGVQNQRMRKARSCPRSMASSMRSRERNGGSSNCGGNAIAIAIVRAARPVGGPPRLHFVNPASVLIRGASGVTDHLASLLRRARLPGLLLVCALLAACEDGEPPPLPIVALEPALGEARFDRPVEVGAYPGERLFVGEQGGLVHVLRADGNDRRVLLDLREHIDVEKGEGLLSVALDPGYERNGYLWAYYFAAGEPPRSVLARFEVVEDAVDPATRLEVLVLPQPGYNQNGGAIRFGPDGMLYLSLGDGSAATDPFENGQNLGTLLGSVVRIDVRDSSPAQPYAVPPDNPFVGVERARDEIWAYGFRNPWRMAFDPEGGALWLGDVGFIDNEEVNRVGRGANHGWNVA